MSWSAFWPSSLLPPSNAYTSKRPASLIRMTPTDPDRRLTRAPSPITGASASTTIAGAGIPSKRAVPRGRIGITSWAPGAQPANLSAVEPGSTLTLSRAKVSGLGPLAAGGPSFIADIVVCPQPGSGALRSCRQSAHDEHNFAQLATGLEARVGVPGALQGKDLADDHSEPARLHQR